MNTDMFKDYGADDKSIQQLIEEFAFGLMMKGLTPPKKIVFDEHTYNRYGLEIQQSVVGDMRSGPTEVVEPLKKKIQDKIDTHVSSAGTIEIVKG